MAYGVCGVVIALASAPVIAAQSAEAVAELTDGVTSIAAPGTPSPLCAWSKDAWIVLVGNAGNGIKAPAVVAGRADAGHFLALPHDGYFKGGTGSVLEKPETARFLANATHWVARASRKTPKVGARSQELADLLNKNGCAAHVLGTRPLAEELAEVDVLCGLSTEIKDAEVDLLEKFVRDGGGVIAGQCAWGWLQVSNKASLDDNPLQRLFGRFGVAWTGGFLGKTGGDGFSTEREPPRLTHADPAFDYLRNHNKDLTKIKNDQPMFQASATMTALVRVLPADDKLLRPRLLSVGGKKIDQIDPTPSDPLVKLSGANRALFAFLIREAERARPQDVKPFAAAKSFPGAVPGDAPRVPCKRTIDTAQPRWHSTGLYAAPGEVINLAIPAPAAGVGIWLQIGAHTDELFELDEWQRAPKVVSRVPVTALTTPLASPLGGLIYLDVPDGCAIGKVEIEIAGGVAAPWFELGRDNNATWKAGLRNQPAPWAELASDKIVVTVPSSAIRGLDDPEALLAMWNRVADAAADLVALPRARKSPERYVADVQLAAGYMHSGYPIMTHLDAVATMTDPAKLAAGDWGLFHELGHNHQGPEWTFEGTGEVTNNIVCCYILETVCGVKVMEGHADLNGGASRIAAHLAAGAPFDAWKKDPFLALQMYLQVEQAFGWDVFKKAFSDYQSLPRRERPRTDDTKRDLWLVTLSRACHRNLGPFFQAWGIPTSDAARATVADLLAWMPEGFPPK